MATASRFGGVLDENASARTFSSKPTTVQRTALGNLTNTRASQKPRQGKASSSSSACQPLSCGPRKREARTKPTFSTEDMEASRMAFKLRVKQEEEDGPDFDYMDYLDGTLDEIWRPKQDAYVLNDSDFGSDDDIFQLIDENEDDKNSASKVSQFRLSQGPSEVDRILADLSLDDLLQSDSGRVRDYSDIMGDVEDIFGQIDMQL